MSFVVYVSIEAVADFQRFLKSNDHDPNNWLVARVKLVVPAEVGGWVPVILDEDTWWRCYDNFPLECMNP